jgi:hypothetical protein
LNKTSNRGTALSAQLKLTLAAVSALALAFTLSACQNVASYTQPTLARVIDASASAPALNVTVEGTPLAVNLGQGTISDYGTFAASQAAAIKLTATNDTTNTALLTGSATLLAGTHHSILIADNTKASLGYSITVLEDPHTAAASGHSSFRFINAATKAGAVDIYLVPSSSTLAKSSALITNLAVNATPTYISFASQTVSIVIVATGTNVAPTTTTTTVSTLYSSDALALTGGEVRTVLLVDSKLTASAIDAYTANDMN